MFFNIKTIKKHLNNYNIKITGTLHIGAHECEELNLYRNLGITTDNMIWIEANQRQVYICKKRGIKNIYNYLITDKDDDDVHFNISNNIQSSSIFEFGTHKVVYPYIKYTKKVIMKSIKIDTFVLMNNIDIKKYNFWTLDIQGAELLALKGAEESLKHVQVLCLEVNEKELYKNCAMINEIDEFLLNFDFKRVDTYMTRQGWGDALYIKQNMTHI